MTQVERLATIVRTRGEDTDISMEDLYLAVFGEVWSNISRTVNQQRLGGVIARANKRQMFGERLLRPGISRGTYRLYSDPSTYEKRFYD